MWIQLLFVIISIVHCSIRCQSWGKTLKCTLGSPENLKNMYDDEISELEFTNCNLRFLDPTWLKQFPKLSKVHLNGNQLDCSCFTRRKIKAFIDKNIKLFGHCAFPKEFVGIALNNITLCGNSVDYLFKLSNSVETQKKKRNSNFPLIINKKSGSSLVLNCSSTAGIQISWIKDNIPFTSNERVHAQNEYLFFDFVRLIDAGNYQCATRNNNDTLEEFNLHVHSKPEVRIDKKAYFPLAGIDFEIKCNVLGYPKPDVTWQKNNQPINNKRITILNDGAELVIRNIEEFNDNGQYKCTAKNIFGISHALCEVQVSHVVPPYLHATKINNISGYVGGSVAICCLHSGIPEPSIKWMHNGYELNFYKRHSLSADRCLTISNLTIDDRGDYECVLQNVGGYVKQTIWIDIVDPVIKPISKEFFETLKRKALQQNDNITLNTVNYILKHQLPLSIDSMSYWFRYKPDEIRDLRDAEKIFRLIMNNARDHLEKLTSTKRYPLLNVKDIRPDSYNNYMANGLSALHIHRIAELTGCFPHQQISKNCTSKCLAYRTADGTCNNLNNPMWGASQTAQNRWLPSQYENGFNLPKGWNESMLYNGHKLPSARLVSNNVISANQVQPDPKYTHMLMQWGQFIDHDFTHTLMPTGTHEFSDARLCTSSCTKEAPCFPIRIPTNDPRESSRGNCIEFVRSTDVCLTGETSFLGIKPIERQQINQITSYMDASNVYGGTEQELHDLREHTFGKGLLRMRSDLRFPKRMLPFAVDTPVDCQRDRDSRASPVGCFLAGDHRASEQLGLAAMHTIWARQHNRLASKLSTYNPHWSSEQVFQETRKIVSAQVQHITYNDWLPNIIGKHIPTYTGYKHDQNSQIANVISTAAFRFGHSLINPIIYRLNASMQPIKEGNLLLRDAFFSPWRILVEGGIDPLLRGMYGIPTKIKSHGQIVNKELTEQLFHIIREISQDLAALNIQRGRDHGLPSYVEWCRYCNLSEPKDFNDLRSCSITDSKAISKLKKIYGDVRNIDVWVGGILEDVVKNGKVGPLFQCLITKQFTQIRNGDRFWYENLGQFSKHQLDEIRQSNLAKIICENSDNIKSIPSNVFIRATYPRDYSSCSSLKDVDLSYWKNCCNANVVNANKACNNPSIHNYNPLPLPKPY